MGSQSFGKGSVQQQKPLGDGTAIHITIARYYTPSGRSIQNEGITPDVEVLHSKVEVLEKKESSYSEASFKNSLKNDKSKKKDKKKSDKGDSDADEDTPFAELSDEEKDARDYQLQRAMGMVIAMGKMQSRGYVVADAVDAETEIVEETTEN
jgi:carboxyl-terminal processing protease